MNIQQSCFTHETGAFKSALRIVVVIPTPANGSKPFFTADFRQMHDDTAPHAFTAMVGVDAHADGRLRGRENILMKEPLPEKNTVFPHNIIPSSTNIFLSCFISVNPKAESFSRLYPNFARSGVLYTASRSAARVCQDARCRFYCAQAVRLGRRCYFTQFQRYVVLNFQQPDPH